MNGRCQGPVVGKGWDAEEQKEGWYHCAGGRRRVAQDKISRGQISRVEGRGEDFGFYSG